MIWETLRGLLNGENSASDDQNDSRDPGQTTNPTTKPTANPSERVLEPLVPEGYEVPLMQAPQMMPQAQKTPDPKTKEKPPRRRFSLFSKKQAGPRPRQARSTGQPNTLPHSAPPLQRGLHGPGPMQSMRPGGPLGQGIRPNLEPRPMQQLGNFPPGMLHLHPSRIPVQVDAWGNPVVRQRMFAPDGTPIIPYRGRLAPGPWRPAPPFAGPGPHRPTRRNVPSGPWW